jgi:hypothetical protein
MLASFGMFQPKCFGDVAVPTNEPVCPNASCSFLGSALLGFVPNTLARALPFLANASIRDVGSENHRNRRHYFLT